MSPILCHRSSLESQKSVAVLDKIGSYRTSSTVCRTGSRKSAVVPEEAKNTLPTFRTTW